MVRRSRSIAPFVLTACSLACIGAAGVGCSGDTARLHLSAPQIADMAPDILADAELGARVQYLAGQQQRGEIDLPCDLALITGAQPISEGLAESKREHRVRFRELVNQLARRPMDDGGGK